MRSKLKSDLRSLVEIIGETGHFSDFTLDDNIMGFVDLVELVTDHSISR